MKLKKKELGEISGLIKCLEISSNVIHGVKIKKKHNGMRTILFSKEMNS